METFKVEMIE